MDDKATAEPAAAAASQEGDHGVPLIPQAETDDKKHHHKKVRGKATKAKLASPTETAEPATALDATTTTTAAATSPVATAAAAEPAASTAPAPVKMDPKEQMREAATNIQRRQDAIDRVRERNKALEPKKQEKHKYLMYQPPELQSVTVDKNQDAGESETTYVQAKHCVCCCFSCC